MKLRDYQQEAYDNTLKVFETADSALVVMATGLGKTIYFSHIAKHYMKTGRVMVLAHREELITQARDKMKIITGVQADVEMGQQWATRSPWFQSELIVSTVQTQIAGRDGGRMTDFDPDDFSLLIIDEAHHAPSDTYKRLVEYYTKNPKLKVLGVTATPDRHDEKAMGQIFKEVAYEYYISDAISDGWLVDIEQRSVFVSSLDYSQVRTTAGDLNGKDLATVLEFEANLHEIASSTLQIIGDKKTLIFAHSIVQANRLTEIINRRKPGSAQFVHGKTPKELRREMFAAYAVGEFQYLVNVGVATEGFDDPSIQCIVMARPTKSKSLFTQMLGRGTRPLTGTVDGLEDSIARRDAIGSSEKPCIIVLDFVGNAGKHKLVTPVDILGGKYPDDVVELAGKNAAEHSNATGKPANVATELQQAEREIAKRNADAEEAAIREKIILNAKYSTALVNPFDAFDIIPCREVSWHKDKQPSAKQLKYLRDNGVDTDGLSYDHVKQVMDVVYKKKQNAPPSKKMAALLRRFKYNPETMTQGEANVLVKAIIANGWRRPKERKQA